jgi:hypothetical protein
VHPDLNFWSVVIGILALTLSLPLGIAGNLLAPRVADWWSRRSKASLGKRIEKLERELNRLEAEPLLTKNEETIARMLEQIVFAFGSLFGVIIFIIYRLTHGPYVRFSGFGLEASDAFEWGLLIGTIVGSVGASIRLWRKERTEKYREVIRTKLQKLKAAR